MLLEVKNLTVRFKTGSSYVTAVNDISFSLDKEDSLGLVGESGCGKSTTAYALMNLLARSGKIESGQVLIEGKDMVSLSDKEMRDIQWKDIAIVFSLTAVVLVFQIIFRDRSLKHFVERIPWWLLSIGTAAMAYLILAATGDANAFIYFQF